MIPPEEELDLSPYGFDEEESEEENGDWQPEVKLPDWFDW